MNNKLKNIVEGKRVLFVDGIRKDQMSGGNTSTKNILSCLSELCKIRYVNIAPSSGRFNSLLYVVTSFPAALFLLIKRQKKIVWAEFFLRFSPCLLIYILYYHFKHKTNVVVFNHHSTFYLNFFIKYSPKVFIWHDVPSSKVVEGKSELRDRDRKACACIENTFTRQRGAAHFTFSFTDKKILGRLHRLDASILPVFNKLPAPFYRVSEPNSWLLVGNWLREENRNGAESFFVECLCHIPSEIINRARFHIAGYGADLFLTELGERFPDVHKLRMCATPSYTTLTNFTEFALLAPLLDGAGIKVKTLEAWAHNIPVVGTNQAFTGIPTKVWQKGGIRVNTIKELAQICFDENNASKLIDKLAPLDAFALYQSATQ